MTRDLRHHIIQDKLHIMLQIALKALHRHLDDTIHGLLDALQYRLLNKAVSFGEQIGGTHAGHNL